MIQEFLDSLVLDSLDNYRYWQLRKVEDYLVTLHDYVFWQYLESMENFERLRLEYALEGFSEEPDPELPYLTEEKLPKVQKYFTN